MARHRAALAEALHDGPATRVAARDHQWDILRDAGGLPVAAGAGRPAAVGDGDGRFERINYALVMADRERVGRDASPSAAIIDSQSVKTTEAGGPRGYDAGKKVNGRKRHALVDTDGRGLVIEPHPASVQDRDGGGPLLSLSRRSFPFIQRVFADAGYAGERVAGAASVALEIVRKAPNQIGFAVQPRRWVVERFFAWIGRNRRLAKDFEATIALRQSLPLRRLGHAPRALPRTVSMSFKTDSNDSLRMLRGGCRCGSEMNRPLEIKISSPCGPHGAPYHTRF